MTIAERKEIGQHRKRVEDPKLVQGQGCYVDDLRLPGTLEVAFVRSAFAHARLTRVDTSGASQAPGVVAVLTGQDVLDVPRLPNRLPFEDLKLSPLPPLAHGTVTLMGYPLVAIVAESRYQARDAAELVEIEYDPLPAVTTPEAALEPGAPLVHPNHGTNQAYSVAHEGGDLAAAFANADGTLSLRIQHSRVAQVPMEPRGILLSYDREADFLTVWRSTQSPFLTRRMLSAALQRPESTIRVIAPDVGGAFGSKSALYPDELTVALLAMRLGRPIRWVSTRIEDLHLTLQGRDMLNLVDVAYMNDGRIVGLKTRSIFNCGGVLLHPQAAPPLRVLNYATGAYKIPAFRAEAVGVYTNTSPTGPYRGAGRPEAGFLAERAIEAVAAKLGLDHLEIRRRNFIPPTDFPYRTPVGSVFDSGNYPMTLERALELADYDALRAEQREIRSRSQPSAPLRGVGIATTIEVSGQGQEFGSVEVDPDGTIVARTGSSSHGQGHETSFCQIVADRLGVPFERVKLLHGDTAETPSGAGTGGSRSLVLGGGALSRASDAVRERALRVASAMLETAIEDLVYARGGVEVAGAPDRRVDLGEIAAAAREGVGLEPGELGLREDDDFAPQGDAVPFGVNIAVVDVDPETGRVDLRRLIAVDDCGVVVNPLIVDGQVAGGLAQGIGEALYEHIECDQDGTLLTASLLDYAVPTAHMVPDYELAMTETPSPNNPIGAKGVGESGCVSAPPAIVNAVLDALAPLGVADLSMPLTSDKVWRAIRGAERG